MPLHDASTRALHDGVAIGVYPRLVGFNSNGAMGLFTDKGLGVSLKDVVEEIALAVQPNRDAFTPRQLLDFLRITR